jgi:hypothetical protein
MCSVTTFELWLSLQCFRVDPKIIQGDLAYADAMAIVLVGVREERIAFFRPTGVLAFADQSQKDTDVGTPRRATRVRLQLVYSECDDDASRLVDYPSLYTFLLFMGRETEDGSRRPQQVARVSCIGLRHAEHVIPGCFEIIGRLPQYGVFARPQTTILPFQKDAQGGEHESASQLSGIKVSGVGRRLAARMHGIRSALLPRERRISIAERHNSYSEDQ